MSPASVPAPSAIDLNADLGESFGAWRLGDDVAMLDLVTSANVACGFHAGDPLTVVQTCRAAAARGVAIGAHVSYQDLAGFGRRSIDVPEAELHAEVLYQIAALSGVAAAVGARVAYVKPHGALYNRIVHDETQAAAVARAVRDSRPESDQPLPLLGLGGSAIAAAAELHGVPFRREAFVDRAYRADGSLVPRSQAGSVLHATDPAGIAAITRRAVRLAVDGRVEASTGEDIAVDVDSLCVHGDTPGAVELAAAVRAALDDAGVTVRAFDEPTLPGGRARR